MLTVASRDVNVHMNRRQDAHHHIEFTSDYKCFHDYCTAERPVYTRKPQNSHFRWTFWFSWTLLIFTWKVLIFMKKVIIFMKKVIIFMKNVLIFTDLILIFTAWFFSKMLTFRSLVIFNTEKNAEVHIFEKTLNF